MKSEADELQSSVGYKNLRRREAEELGALEGEQDAEELAGDNAEGDEGSHGPRPSVDLHARVHEHAEAQAEVHNDLPELLKLVERRGVQHDATIFVEFLHLERAVNVMARETCEQTGLDAGEVRPFEKIRTKRNETKRNNGAGAGFIKKEERDFVFGQSVGPSVGQQRYFSRKKENPAVAERLTGGHGAP